MAAAPGRRQRNIPTTAAVPSRPFRRWSPKRAKNWWRRPGRQRVQAIPVRTRPATAACVSPQLLLGISRKNVGHGNARRRVEWIGRSHDARIECGTRHAVPERSRRTSSTRASPRATSSARSACSTPAASPATCSPRASRVIIHDAYADRALQPARSTSRPASSRATSSACRSGP